MSNDFYQEAADKFIFNVKKGLLYTQNDVWVEFRKDKAKIGVTDFLQRISGDVVFIDLPKEGKIVKRFDEIVNYETIKSVLTVTSPLTGIISKVNAQLNDKSELINSDPFGEGWLVKITPTNIEEEKQHLIIAEKYLDLMKSKINDELKKDKK